MTTVLIVNPKGGCGKTTLATNLASAYATGGFRTVLADADRQKSALDWLDRRSKRAPEIKGLDWSKSFAKPPRGTQRLIIDSPAGTYRAAFKAFLAVADTVVMPVLPSSFDRVAVRHFLDRIEDLKDIRKNRKPVGVVLNQVRGGRRVDPAMDVFLEQLDHPVIARLRSRTLYSDLAENGTGVFERGSKVARSIQDEWSPLLTFIETTGL